MYLHTEQKIFVQLKAIKKPGNKSDDYLLSGITRKKKAS